MERYERARLEISEFAEDVITTSDTRVIIGCEKHESSEGDGRLPVWWIYYEDETFDKFTQWDEPSRWDECP